MKDKEFIKIEIIKGKKLSSSFKNKCKKIMLETFEDKKFAFYNDPFFILKDKGKIVSIGRFRLIKINFLKKNYSVLGIADIVSIIKKKGYGRIVMKHMLQYLKKSKKTGIGFCERKNSRFYKKCGFKIKKDYVDHFIPIDSKGNKVLEHGDDDVLYFNGKDNFMKKVLANKKQKVLIPTFHW